MALLSKGDLNDHQLTGSRSNEQVGELKKPKTSGNLLTFMH